MAIDWGSVIGAVVNQAPQIVQAATQKPVLPSMQTPGILPTVVNTLGVQETANNVLKKSIGASLKQYWWVIAIPCVLLLAIVLKPLFSKKNKW